jgi:fluoride exporter
VSFSGFIAVGGGAAAGAWLRWWLGTLLNPLFPTVPLGTLAANLLGAWLMGLALGFLGHYESLRPEMRLFVTTGFLGGLTTFSTFSAETATLISREQYGWSATMVAVHVGGSVLMTLLGIAMIGMVLKR